MFEEDVEEMADNVVEEQSTPPVETEPVDQTKAFAARLKEEKAKAKLDVQKEIAESFGYDSWDEYMNAQTNNKIIDNGLDPDTVRPLVKDLIKNDPEYIAAMKFKEEKEALEKEMFANASIKALNDKFGTNFTSVDELDKETIDDWNKGTPLEKAFAANNYSKLMEIAVKKANSNSDNGKSHLKTVTGSSEKPSTRELSKDELSVFKMMGISAEDAKAYVNRTK